MDVDRLHVEPLAGRVLDPEGEPAFVIAEWSDDGSTGIPIAPPHVHRDEDEAWYVLEGNLGVRLGDEEVVVGQGGAVFGPHGVAHTYWNCGPGPVRYLLVMGPRTRAALEALHNGTARDRVGVSSLFAEHGIDLL